MKTGQAAKAKGEIALINDDTIKAQLDMEVARLERHLERLKKNNLYFDSQSLRRYQDMLESRRAMLKTFP